jgi:hypothetical protein
MIMARRTMMGHGVERSLHHPQLFDISARGGHARDHRKHEEVRDVEQPLKFEQLIDGGHDGVYMLVCICVRVRWCDLVLSLSLFP